MRTRLVTYAPYGAQTGPLPDPLSHTITTPFGELPTGTVHYPQVGVNASKIASGTEVAFEYHSGTAWIEPPNCRFIPMGGDFNHIEETPTRSYSLLGFGWLLRQAKVWEAGTLPIDADGKVQFLSATAGNIMHTLITKAKARGWASGLAVDFSATQDSSGAAWASVVTIAFDLEISLETILNNLFQQGLCDYRFEGRTLRIFNPDTTMARELPTVRLSVADNQTSAPEQWTDEDRLTDTLVLGDDGNRWTFNNGATGGFGRLERVTTQSGVTDPGTAELLASKDLLAGLATRTSYTREFLLNEATTNRPFQAYLPGDWVRAQRGTTFERLRIMSTSITTTAEKVTGHAVLGDRIDDILAKLAKRTSGITGGASAGGSGGRPAPSGPDGRTPAAPTGLVVSSSAYTDDNGLPQGRLTANWAHPGTATNGTTQTPDRFQLQRRINTVGTPWTVVATTDGASPTSTMSPVPLFKTDGVTAEQYSHRVRAISEAGIAGAWTSETITSMALDTTPPPVPYFQPGDVTTWLRTITVRPNGMGTTTGSDQVTMPADFSHMNVYQNSSSSSVGRVLVGRIAGTWVSGNLPAGVAVWYTLTSVDRSGNESAHSAARSITPVANVDAAAIIATLDAGAVTLTNVGSTSIATGAILQDKLADNAVSQAKLQDQIISSAKLASSVNADIAKGISDAAAAQGTANTANSAAATAQTAANVAKAAADAAVASGVNLVTNGGFETDTVWPLNSAVAYDTAEKRSGTRSIKLTPTAGNVWPVSAYVDSKTGRTYRMEYWIKKLGTDAPVSSSIGAVFQSMNTAGTTSTPISYGTPREAVDISTTAFTKVTIDYTITQADAMKVRFAPWVRMAANTYWVDDLTVTDITDAKEALAAAATAQAKADQAFADAAAAMTAAGNAQSSANGKNNVYYLAALPSGIGFVDGDTTFIRSAEGQPYTAQYRWDTPSLTWKPQTMSHQVIASVDLGKATVGELDGIYIKAKTLDADKLVVGRGSNIYMDGGLLDSTYYNVPSYVVPTGGRNGKGSVQLPMNSLQTGTYYALSNLATHKARRTRVGAGQSYRAGAWVKTSAAAPINTLRIIARLYRESDNAFIYTAPISLYNDGLDGRPGVMPVDTWAWLSGVFLVPANTEYTGMSLGFYKEAGYTTGTTTWSDPTIQQAMTGELIVDGSITAEKVAANEIKARHIVVGDFANLAIGSDFEDAASIPWNLASTTGTPAQPSAHVLSTTQKKSGVNSLRLNPCISAASPSKSYFLGDMKSVKEGEQWLFKFWAFIDTAFNGTGNTKLRIGNQSNAAIGPTNAFDTIARNVWVLVENVLTVPAGTTSLQLELWGDHTAGYAYIDDIQIRRVAEASLIQNLGVEKLTATAASIGTAVVDKLWTEVVRSKRITSDMVVVGRGTNLIVDDFFEQADLKTLRASTSGSWGAWGRDTTLNLNWYGGTLTAGTSRALFLDTVSSYDINSYIPVKEGQKFRLSATFTSTVSGPRGTVRVIYKSGAIGFISTGWTREGGLSNIYEAAGTIKAFERIYTVPADVAYILPALQFESTCTSAYVYGGITFTAMADASLIVDGGILTRHLTVTEDMTVALLNVHKVKAIEIDTIDLSADIGFIGNLRTTILTADWITAANIHATNGITSRHTITGAKFQTEVTLDRGVKFDSAGIKAWNPTGTIMTFNLDAATGNITATGTFKTGSDAAGVLIDDSVWSDRPGVKMSTGVTMAYQPTVFSVAAGASGYTEGSLVVMGGETTANSSGRTELEVQAKGAGFRLRTQYGPNSGCGVTLVNDQLTLVGENVITRGKESWGGTSTDTRTHLNGATTQNAAGTYTFTYGAPPPTGQRRVHVTPDGLAPVQVATRDITASSFKVGYSGPANNSTSVNTTSTWI